MMTTCSDFDRKRYMFTITAKGQARCPKWDTEKDANPPLPASKALAKAKEYIATIETNSGLSWAFKDLALVNIDGWVWRARYDLVVNHGLMTGAWPTMDCWILMDGTVVQPKITKIKT